jgi:hypothetical protein
MGPTLAGFLDFVRTVMGITPQQLPDNSTFLPMSFDIARETVNPVIQQVSPLLFTIATYNLAGDILLTWAPDQPGSTFFKDVRKEWNLLNFVTGVVQSSGDNGTSSSLVVQKAAEDFTLANLQQLKTPYGRAYLAIAQDYGPNIWDVS